MKHEVHLYPTRQFNLCLIVDAQTEDGAVAIAKELVHKALFAIEELDYTQGDLYGDAILTDEEEDRRES